VRRIVLALCTTATALVLLFGYRTSAPPGSAPVVAAVAAVTGQSFSGDVVQTRWGPVQVQVTVADGRVAQATAVQTPDGNGHDVAINARAVPVLNAEAVDAQSADIDTVSGATVTSEGYRASLQSALDAAHL
jgi:uncharacterized protein with FMN-binding domain